MAEAFTWGGGSNKLTGNDRRRRMAESLMKSGADYSPVGHWTQGAARVAQALMGGLMMREADSAEKAGNEAFASALTGALGGGQTAAASAPSAAPSESRAAAGASPTPPAALLPHFARNEAQYGLPTNYLPQVANIESRFDPNAANPNSSARGLFQFTKGTARDYGLANPLDPIASTEAAARLAADNAKILTRVLGRAPNAGELYLAHQQGGGGASKLLANPNALAVDLVGHDAVRLNGGHAGMTAGEFARRWTRKVAENAADAPAPGAVPASMETGAAGFTVPEGDPTPPAPMDAQTFNAIQNGEAVQPVFQSEGIGQPWMGTAMPPAAPQVAQATLPPPRPADLALPQADMPAPGAVPAMGQMPAAPPPDLSNENDAGSRIMAALGGASPSAASSPFSGVARALMGGQGAVPAAGAPASGGAPAATTSGASSNPMAQLAVALARSGDRDGAVRLATSLLQPQAPIVMGDRLVSRDGRVIADFTGANGGRSKSYGLNPIWGTDSNGNPVIGQIGEKGDFVQTRMPENFKLSSGVDRIDAGTHWVLQDKRNGQTVGTIPKDIAGEEKAKVEGKAAGAASTGLSQALATADNALKTIDQVRNHPGRDQFGATGAGTALPIIGDGLPNTKGRDFVVLVDQLKGKAFLEAFESLKGAGQITEVEGAKATAAIARLDRAQTREGFDAALNDLEAVIRSGMERSRQKAGAGSAAPAAPSGRGGGQTRSGVKWSVE